MTESTAVATAQPARQVARVENIQPMFDTDRFEHFQRAASALMHSSILNPSIRGDSPQQCFSNLMLVFDLSERWKLPAMSIAQCISIVHTKVVYEGKLIQAALDASLGVTLYPWWTGERGSVGYRIYLSDVSWDDMDDEAMAQLKPGVQIRGRRIIDGSVDEWRTFGKDQRTPNPAWTGAATQNQLLYRGSREWARRFEPAHLLGVYGDDEIEQIQSRMDRARDVTPAAPGLSSGFTKPAAQAEPIVEAEIEDAVVEEVVEEKPVEKAKAPRRKKAADAQGDPVEAAREGGQDGQVEDEATAGAQAEPDGPSKSDIDARALAAYEATFCGQPHTYDEGEDYWPDDARAEIDKSAQTGADEYEDALELAYQQGHAGQMMTEMQPPADATGLTMRWKALRKEWEKGAAQAKSEADVDQTSDKPDAAEADGEGELKLSAIDSWAEQLQRLNSWGEIKPALHGFSQSPEWKAMDALDLAEVRSLAWAREHAIIEAKKEKFDFLNDLTAFRCWIEWADDADAIEGNWQAIASMPHFGGLGVDQQKALGQAVESRIAALGGGE